MITISRNRVLNDNHVVEDSWVKIWYGYHSKLRLDERGKGSLAIRPEKVKLTRNSIVKGYILEGKLNKLVVRIDYSYKEQLFLVLTPSYYKPNDFFVKSLWFRDKLKDNVRILRTNRTNIPNSVVC